MKPVSENTHRYVDQEKLAEETDELLAFINKELEIQELNSVIMLLNQAASRIQGTLQENQQNQGSNMVNKPDQDADYIG